MPLEPREVCYRFIEADSLKEAKRYATTNLWPALEALDALEDEEAFADDRFDLTDEGPAPTEVGGYLVGYRMYLHVEDGAHTIEGFFHLVDYEAAWKIEDWYVSSFDQEVAPEPVSMAANYREVIADIAPDDRVANSKAASSSLFDATASYMEERPEMNVAAITASRIGVYSMLRKSGKRILAGAGVVLLAIFAVSDNLPTNPQLPPMANWICIYAIAVSPALWLIGTMAGLMAGPSFHEDSNLFGAEILLLLLETAVSLAITVVLFLGGIWLRSLRRSGPILLKVGLWAGFGWLALYLLIFTFMCVVAEESDWAKPTTGAEIVSFLVLCVAVFLLTFDVIVLVWLHRFGNTLPLRNDTVGQGSPRIPLDE